MIGDSSPTWHDQGALIEMAEQFSLDLLSQHILAVRGDVRLHGGYVAAHRDRLDHHQEELDVVSGRAMRATGERVVWASVQAQLRNLAARLAALEIRKR